jgi:hypothetical protein
MRKSIYDVTFTATTGVKTATVELSIPAEKLSNFLRSMADQPAHPEIIELRAVLRRTGPGPSLHS